MYVRFYGREEWREWYRISAPSGTKLLLSLAPEALAEFRRINWPETPIVERYQEGFGLGQFALAEQAIGFGGVGSLAVNSAGWGKILFDLALIGRRRRPGQSPAHYERGQAVSATLTVLFSYLTRLDQDLPMPKGEPHQALVVDAFFLGKDGCPLGADLSVEMKCWLEEKAPLTGWEEVESAIRQAYDAMSRGFGLRRGFSRYYCRASVREPVQLVLDCPGDACGLFVDGMFRYEENRGLELTCHNVDTPIQQLTLLAGLAKVCDLFRREQTKK